MGEVKIKTKEGIVSIILSIIGLIMIFLTVILNLYILPLSWLAVAIHLLWVFTFLLLGILSIIFGRRAKKYHEPYSNYGVTLGIITTTLAVVWVLGTINYLYKMVSMWPY